jgi:hypothetical protein
MADKKKKKISEMTSAEIKKKYPKFEDLPKNLLSGVPQGLMKRVDKGIPLTHSPVKSPARRVPTKEELGKASGGAVNKNYAYGGRVAKMSAEKS